MGTPQERAEAACHALYDRLSSDWREEGTLFLGPEIARSPEPQVQRLHARGAHFCWVAAALHGASFWELHVGAVIDPETLQTRVGIHRASASAIGTRLLAELEPDLLARGYSNVDSPLADEIQIVGAPHDPADTREVAAICDEVRALVRQAQPLLQRILE